MQTTSKSTTSATAVITMVLAATAGCSSGSNPSADTGAGPAAQAVFWDTLRSGHLAGMGAVHDQLVAAYGTEPNDPIACRLIGMTLNAQFAPTGQGDAGPPPGFAGGDAGVPPGLLEPLGYFKRAVDLDSTNPQHYEFYATGLYGEGEFGDNAAHDQALQMWDQVVIPKLPGNGYSDRGTVLSIAPYQSSDFALALESFFRFYETCSGAVIDRTQPDLTPFVQAQAAGRFPSDICENTPHHVHTVEGLMFVFGDDLVKAQNISAAKAVYATLATTRDFAEWPYKVQYEARVSSDLNARAQLYTTGNPVTEPHLGTTPTCLGCHQE